MSRTVTVGIDGSRESLAAAEWAAREARLRALPLRLVNVWETVPEVMGRPPMLGTGTRPDGQHEQHGQGRIAPGETGAGKILGEVADGVRARHPGVDVAVEQLTGLAREELVKTAEEAELLVLGSRGLSGIAGFLLGSVGLHVVAHTGRPVVLVRAGEQAADDQAPDRTGTPSAATSFRPVVLGLDTGHPDPTLIRFAFEAAALRESAVRILHDWSPPPHSGLRERPGPEADLVADLGRLDAVALTDVLRPWRQEYPSVEVVEESRRGKAADHLLEASRDASLVVVGRRVRRSPLGAHIGPVAHAVLHHAGVPVAVVAHD
ncbi:universal stress protein [Streptomyces sp. DSM 40750]|uniref:universal stress protein n=1 Tax=Streptomyces sp. DSM 40750 TaxID=2801030 RepID=UPI00214C8FE4|nr:universal stress protein [Streptomyces sp. DSM 40750]UUU20514.1 universal stress protein [Streptomyces sp. DSM 40750]